jgi:Pyruvate/2-oxoacid:ferredoxin oxidoreductase gamma subunit
MVPEYITVVIGNKEKVIALKFTLFQSIIASSILASIPLARKSNSIALGIMFGVTWLSQNIKMIKTE